MSNFYKGSYNCVSQWLVKTLRLSATPALLLVTCVLGNSILCVIFSKLVLLYNNFTPYNF